MSQELVALISVAAESRTGANPVQRRLMVDSVPMAKRSGMGTAYLAIVEHCRALWVAAVLCAWCLSVQ